MLKKIFTYLLMLLVFAAFLTNCSTALTEDEDDDDDSNESLLKIIDAEEYGLVGYWANLGGQYEDGFEIVKDASDDLYLYQYDDGAKSSLSFSGEILNARVYKSNTTTGYLTLQITDAGTWSKTLGEYMIVSWNNFVANTSIGESTAYKSGEAGTLSTQAAAEKEQTIENGYFSYYGTYAKQ